MRISDSLNISAIKSGKGDCICISYIGISGAIRYIVVDTGPTSCSREFRALYENIILSNGKIDILFITHYDDDHIGGILKLAESGLTLSVDKVYFNAYKHGAMPTPNLSAMQNQRLFHLLLPTAISTPVIAGETVELDGASITVLSPTKDDLNDAMEKMKSADYEYVPLSNISDWSESIDSLMNKAYPTSDSSISNRASLVLEFKYNEIKILLCGDAPSERIINRLKEQTRFDIVKLPHHGSSRNISDRMFSLIDADTFMICADGSAHPNKETIAKLLKHYENIRILTNYPWWLNGFIIDDDRHWIEEGKLIFENIDKEESDGKI